MAASTAFSTLTVLLPLTPSSSLTLSSNPTTSTALRASWRAVCCVVHHRVQCLTRCSSVVRRCGWCCTSAVCVPAELPSLCSSAARHGPLLCGCGCRLPTTAGLGAPRERFRHRRARRGRRRRALPLLPHSALRLHLLSAAPALAPAAAAHIRRPRAVDARQRLPSSARGGAVVRWGQGGRRRDDLSRRRSVHWLASPYHQLAHQTRPPRAYTPAQRSPCACVAALLTHMLCLCVCWCRVQVLLRVSFAVDVEDVTGRQRTFCTSNGQSVVRMGEDVCSMPLQLVEGWNRVSGGSAKHSVQRLQPRSRSKSLRCVCSLCLCRCTSTSPSSRARCSTLSTRSAAQRTYSCGRMT